MQIDSHLVAESETDLDVPIGQYTGGHYYILNYESLHALHIQMIQKQQHEIESLKQENISLKGEIEIIKQRIQNLEVK